MKEKVVNGSESCVQSTKTALIRQIYRVQAMDFASAGEISGKIKNILKQLGVNGEMIRRAAIASYEAEIRSGYSFLGRHLILCGNAGGNSDYYPGHGAGSTRH